MERRRTKQRNTVLEAVMELNHPTAQEMYEYILSKHKDSSADKRISLGTVYRNLQILEETRRVVAVYANPLVMHYDTRLEPHYHIRCKKCGAVRDIDMPYRFEFNGAAQEASGWAVDSHNLAFAGLCAGCRPAG